jgi:hypothetical protein
MPWKTKIVKYEYNIDSRLESRHIVTKFKYTGSFVPNDEEIKGGVQNYRCKPLYSSGVDEMEERLKGSTAQAKSKTLSTKTVKPKCL